MKRFFAILVTLIVLGVGSIWFIYFRGGKKRVKGPKPVPMAVSQHSERFDGAVGNLLTAYYAMSEGFVNWDTVAVGRSASELKAALDSIPLDEMKSDTTGIYQSAVDAITNSNYELANLQSAPDIAAKRVAFKGLSENLRLLLIVVKYDRQNIYWQECPMALGDDVPANWLSKTEEIRNPYLGTQHPDYKAKMLGCGESKGLVVDTTRH